jgi:hypothetical protein
MREAICALFLVARWYPAAIAALPIGFGVTLERQMHWPMVARNRRMKPMRLETQRDGSAAG